MTGRGLVHKATKSISPSRHANDLSRLVLVDQRSSQDASLCRDLRLSREWNVDGRDKSAEKRRSASRIPFKVHDDICSAPARSE